MQRNPVDIRPIDVELHVLMSDLNMEHYTELIELHGFEAVYQYMQNCVTDGITRAYIKTTSASVKGQA